MPAQKQNAKQNKPKMKINETTCPKAESSKNKQIILNATNKALRQNKMRY